MQTRTIYAALLLSFLLLAVPLAGQQAPEEEKGFRPEKFYSFGSLDHVNTFNGNLVVSIPIGMRYPLDGGFTYGLSLTYNSKMWDFDEWDVWQRAYPSKRANAGLGWLLTMGRLVEPNDPTNPTNEWLYESPDGADHKFAADFLYTNIGCTGSYCADTSYTHDGSFLRMRKLTSALRTVESGDGTTSEFELVSGNWRLKRIYNAYKDASGNPLNYVNVTYPDPGTIAYCPGASVIWRLADSKGRIHFVCLKDRNVGGDQTPTVDRVVLEGVGQYATYFFEYDPDREVVENCQDTVPPTQETPVHAYDVPVLRRLKLPDGTDSLCGTGDCSRFEFETHNGGCSSGALESIVLPTKGKISYTYEAKNIQPENPCNLRTVDTVGVSTRKLWPATGTTPIGTWTYKVGRSLKGSPDDYESYASCGTGPMGHELHPLIYDEAVGSVLDPAGNKFVQRFNTWPGNPGHTDYDETSRDGFKKQEYGLPIGKFDPAVNANLSREVLGGCDASGNNCTLLRQSYVRYRLDPAHWPASIAHQTIVTERTVYHDVPAGSPTRYAHVEYSDYDGFGHYRKATTSGSFDGDNGRETYTNFNPGSNCRGVSTSGCDENASGTLLFSTEAPWILGTYDTVTVTDSTGTSTSRYCFDPATGWLRAVRTGDQTSNNDLVTLFTPETTSGGSPGGNLAMETYYGGDGTPLTAPSQSICTMANGGNPGSIGYRIRHTYSYGQRATSRHDGMPFFSLDRDIHPTGLTQATRGEDGVAATSYEYFRDGRLKRIVPSGQAATDYVYTHASVSGSSFTPARVKATTISTTAGTVETEYQFDALGRYWREKQRMPNGTWSLREMLYDALDRKTSVSEPATITGTNELAFNPPHDTTFTNYDAFGRARTITTPDNKATTFVFSGVSETTRTAGIATGQTTDTPASTTEKYDRHGRLISVIEPGNIVTSYTYDVGDRLMTVTMGIQTRTFDYDSRGFLRWESHPESGMTAYTYDARGHVLTKTQSAASSLFDLTYLYDAAERPLEVRGRNPHYVPGNPDQPQFRLMKKFVYGTANGTDDLRLGKLWTASRYNYDPADPDGFIYKVSETWKYGDVAGRKTHRLTSITKGVAGLDEAYWQAYRDVQTEVVYNDLNLPQTVKYPSCLNCGTWNPGVPVPVRNQSYTYTGGRLATVPGVLNSISYWPNGMWNTMGRSNNMTDTQTIDSGMARPASISAALSDSCAVPVITSDPVGGTVTASNPVLLSVSVSGTGPFTYEWWNENQLVGNSPTFTATTANTPVTTRYRVLVRNACKTVESVAATVSVGECIAPGASATFEPKADGGYTLVATGTGTEPRTYTWRRTSDQAWIGTGRRVSIGPLAQTTTYTVTVANACAGSPVTANVTVEVQSAIQAVLTATRTANANQVHVTWTGPTSGVTYTLQRRSGAGWTDLVTLSAAALSARTYDDNSVAAGKTYAYRLKNDDEQTSNADVATTTAFTQVPVDAQITNSSWNSVFTAINSVRAAVGWPAVAWSNILSSNDPLPAPGEHIRAVHVMSTRARMNEALQALGVTVQPYTPGDVKGAKVEASHLNDIMNRAK